MEKHFRIPPIKIIDEEDDSDFEDEYSDYCPSDDEEEEEPRASSTPLLRTTQPERQQNSVLPKFIPEYDDDGDFPRLEIMSTPTGQRWVSVSSPEDRKLKQQQLNLGLEIDEMPAVRPRRHKLSTQQSEEPTIDHNYNAKIEIENKIEINTIIEENIVQNLLEDKVDFEEFDLNEELLFQEDTINSQVHDIYTTFPTTHSMYDSIFYLFIKDFNVGENVVVIDGTPSKFNDLQLQKYLKYLSIKKKIKFYRHNPHTIGKFFSNYQKFTRAPIILQKYLMMIESMTIGDLYERYHTDMSSENRAAYSSSRIEARHDILWHLKCILTFNESDRKYNIDSSVLATIHNSTINNNQIRQNLVKLLLRMSHIPAVQRKRKFSNL